MKTFITTLIILLSPFICSYSSEADPNPTETPFSTTTPDETPSSSATPFSTNSPTSFSATTPTASPAGDLTTQTRDLDRRMDTIFSDAFRNANQWFNHSTLASSVNLREQKDKYVARVYLPHFDTSTAQVKVENGALHIVANGEKKGNGNTQPQKYEQTISLPQPVQTNDIKVQRKPDLLVITVPKETTEQSDTASSTATPSPETSSDSAANDYEWEDSIANEFARMNEAMDRALHETFPDSSGFGPQASQLESAVKMDDQKDKYVVHFYLPEQNLSNVRVKFDNGQLHLRAKEQSGTTSAQTSGSSPEPDGNSVKVTGEYTATISVPGPVNESEMKVDRQANAVVVTLPKA